MRHSYRKGAVGVAVAAVGLAAFAGPALADTSAPSVALKGSVPSWAHAAKGHASGSSAVRLTVVLNLRNPQGAAKLAAAVSDPSSSQYGKYLSADAFRTRFAPTSADVAKVTHWLSRAGLRVADIPANHRWVTVTGTVAQAERAFGTTIDSFAVSGGTATAPASAAKVPASVAGLVAGVEGLTSQVRLNSPSIVSANGTRAKATAIVRNANAGATTKAPPDAAFVNGTPCSAYYAQKTATTLPKAYGIHHEYAVCGYTPSQLRGAYGTSGVVAKGLNGKGVTVAIVDAYASPTILSDANTYAVKNGEKAFAAGQFQQISAKPYRYGYYDKVNGDLCGEQGWYGEESLDVEAVHSMAPGANVLFVAGRSCDDPDLIAALNKIVDGHLADIISNSWGGVGEPDPVTQAALLQAYDQTFLQAALTGIGVFFSSGDNGDERLNAGYRTVDYPSSDPLVTGVGGTSLAVGKGNSYKWETGWGTKKSVLTNGAWDPAAPGNYIYGAGGGTSRLFAEPFYQKGVVPSSIANYFKGGPGRAVPDIAADADPTTGMLIGQTQTFPDGTVKYSQYRIGGTSLACPLIAGIEALADQAAGHPHGFANPAIYQLAGSSAVRDVVPHGNKLANVRVDFANGVDAADGLIYSLRSIDRTGTIQTRKGYDDVTGVGTPYGPRYVFALGH
jgi:subtilase family serine protease